MIRNLKLAREHYLNPLHLMCRGMDLGLTRAQATRISKIMSYKINLWPVINTAILTGIVYMTLNSLI